MQDQIVIKDLLVRGIVGVNEWERSQLQDILINMVLFADTRQAGSSDKIEDCVNYRTVTKEVIEHITKSRRFTVEALASDLAKICLAFENVQRVQVRVEKPRALRFAQSVGVEIEREEKDFD